MSLPTFHIVDRFDVPWSGSALEALALRDLLLPDVEVRLWSPTPPHFVYAADNVRLMNPAAGDYPRGETLVLVGGYYEQGEWLKDAQPERIIVKYNSFSHLRFFAWLAALKDAGLPAPRLVFPSRRLREAVAMDGLVEPSPIDIRLFRPAAAKAREQFTIGRMSRDELYKHHEDDLSLYKMLAMDGCRIRIMGGTCLEEYLPADREGIEITPAGSEPPEAFLRSLDCFFYRTGLFEETFGRVVLEAMATGLPVVCHRRGGYTEWIRSGENGFLFDTQEEAFDLLTAMRDDPEKRLRIGQAARETAVKLFGEAARDRWRRWYLGAAESSDARRNQ